MEKKTLRAVTAAFLMAAMPAFAGSYAVTADQAKAMVGAWSAENKGGFGLDGASVLAVAPFTDASGQVLGYAVKLTDGRCVFTSADTRVEPVIAVVSDCDGRLPASHPLRALLRADLASRLAAVSGAASGPSFQSVSPAATKLSQSIRAARAKWARCAGGASLQSVDPSIATPNGNPPLTYAYLPGFSNANGSHYYLTHWNQSYEKTGYDFEDGEWNATQVPVYNYYTPHNYVCGCVATATATVLQYFNVPAGPVAVTNTCTVNGEKVDLATIGGLYDWSILPENMGGAAANVDNLSEAQRELLGRVTYDAGVLLGMAYDNNGTGSGAGGLAPAKVLKDHYGFKTAEALSGPFDKAIYNHLRCDSPVILSIIKEGAMMGHEVVAVGYGRDVAGTDYTRVFMGWGGSSDAWYQLPDITSDYNIVNGAIAMLSLDGACVPFVGQIKTDKGLGATGVEVSVPGVTNVLTGANGLFAFRLTEKQAKSVKELQITAGPFETNIAVTVGKDLTASTNLPDAVEFVLPAEAVSVPSCTTPDEAARCALNSTPQRLICMLSGRDGDPGTEAIKAYLAANADAFNAKFAFYYADVDTDGYYLQDGMPSIGVFNPAVFKSAGGWSYGNGRLGYLNAQTDDIDDASLEAMLAAAAEKGAKVLANDVVVTVSAGQWKEVPSKGGGGFVIEGAAEMKWSEIADGFAGDPGVGRYPNTFTNGEEVVLTCAAEFTNAVAGVVYRCAGWELYDAGTEALVEDGDSCEAAFTVGLPDLDFRWVLEPAAYHVTVKTQCRNGAPDSGLDALVTTTDAWVPAGETLELVASPLLGEKEQCVWRFVSWSGAGVNKEDVDCPAVTVQVDGACEILATFEKQSVFVAPSAEPVTGTVKVGALAHVGGKDVDSLPAGKVPPTLLGSTSIGYGTDVTVPAGQLYFTLAETNFVYQGTNWVVSGWTNGRGLGEATGTGARVPVALEGGKTASFDWVWTPAIPDTVAKRYAIDWTNSLDNLSAAYQTNLVSSADLASAGMTLDDLQVSAPKGFKVSLSEKAGKVVAKLALDEEVLRPAAGSALTIEAQGDGSIVVRGKVLNGVKGFWYSLYSADDLTGPWQLVATGEYASGSPAEQARRDAEVEVAITVQPEVARRFYKLRVTDVDPASLD